MKIIGDYMNLHSVTNENLCKFMYKIIQIPRDFNFKTLCSCDINAYTLTTMKYHRRYFLQKIGSTKKIYKLEWKSLDQNIKLTFLSITNIY